MATEEEAREAAADGEEVQVEAVDLGTPHLQMKDQAKIMDSTEGMLKVTEDQVLEKAPSVVEIPPEPTPNGTASSLNGHMKEGEISNEKPQENGQKANEQVEPSPDGIRTDQSNKSNGEEAVDSLGHVESTTEDTSLLTDENEESKEHYQQDVECAAVEEKMVHEDTVETDQPTVDAQQGQNLEPVEVTEDTQHASTSCTHDEVVAEAPAGVQTSLEPDVEDSGALPDASDGNTETEPAKVDKESCTEDEDIAEHANEIIKLEDQPSKQTDDVDAELVTEDVPTSKKTDVPEDISKAEQADESTNPSDQEELNQESAEETIDPVCERTEETSHESNVSTSEETTREHDATAREPALDVQEVQSQGLTEEIAEAKEVDSEKTVQKSGAAFEEATPEDYVATTEPSDIKHLNNVESEEIKGLEDVKTEDTSNESNVIIAEDSAQDKEATEDIQPVQGLEEEPKSIGTVEVDEASNQPHADVNNLAEEDGVPACQPQVTGLEEVKDTGVTETQEIIQQSHAAASEELVTEDNSVAVDSRNDDIQQTLEQGSVKVKDTEASGTQEICHERTISASEEDSAEDDVTAEGPTSDAQEVENAESVEEIKDNTADNIVEASNVATVEEEDKEHNLLTSEDVSEQQMREVEPEEIQSTEHVETEVKETEATKTEALPQESNISTSEEPASEENITGSEQAEDVESNKDTGTKDISGQSNENNVADLEEMATEDNTIILTDASIQQPQEQEPVEFRDIEATEPQGISPSHIVSTSKEFTPEDNMTAEPDSQAENLESATLTGETKDVKSTDAVAEEETTEEHVQEFEAPVHTPSVEEPELEETKNTDNQMDADVLENPTHEDNPTASELLVMKSAEVSSSEATEGQEMPQSEVTQSEDHETEENTTASEPKVLEPEAAEQMRDSEATEPQSISQESIVSSSEESVPEEDATAKEPASDTKEVQTEEPVLTEEHNDVKAEEISNPSSGSIVGETAQENLESSTITEESRDVICTDAIAEESPEEHVQEPEAAVDIPPVEEPELEETKNTEPVEVHGNVAINDQAEEEVNNTEATEIAEIHNGSGDLTEDGNSDVALADKVAPDEHAKATEATADIPQAQDPELEETKNSEPVEVENNIIASDLPEEGIKDTEAMETEVIPDESTSTKIAELTTDALAEEAAPEELVIETEATIDIPRAQEPELDGIKNAEPAEMKENISATEQSAEEIEATDATEAEAINESNSANTSELTEDVTAKEAASDIKEVQTEEPELIDEHNDVKVGEISNQSSRNIVGETDQENLESATVTEETADVKSTDAVAEETPEEHVQEFEAPVHTPSVEDPKLEETKNTDNQMDAAVLDNPTHEHNPSASESLVMESAEVSSSEATEGQEVPQSEVTQSDDHETEENTTASEQRVLEPEAAEEMRDSEATEPQSIVSSSEESVPEEDVAAQETASDTTKVQTEEPELIDERNDVKAGEISNQSSGTIVGETAQENLESSTVTEESRDVKSTDAIAEETPEEHVQEFEGPVDIPPVEQPELEETKNTEPVEVHDNVAINDQPGEEVKNAEATEIAEIHNESGDLTDDVKSDVAVADKAAPDEHAKATEATADIPQAQNPELEETKNSKPVEVENNIIARDLPEEEIKDTEATETEVIPDESTSAKTTELTNDALAEEAAPEELVIQTEATTDIPRAEEPELEEIKNAEPAEVEENISATDQSAEEIEATDATETEAINESINANTSELTEDVTEKAPASEIKEVQTEEPELIDEHNDVKVGEISSQSSRTIVGETAQKNLESATVTEETKDVKSTDAIAEEETPVEHVQEFEAPVDIPSVEEPELEEAKNTEPVSMHDNVMTNDLPAEEVKDTQATEIAEIQNESGHLTEDVKSNAVLSDEAAHDEDAEATEATADIPQAQDPEQEQTKNDEPVEVEDSIIARDLPEEEIKDTEAMETEVIPDESTSAKITELTNDVKSNVALAEEAAPEEHVIETEATIDIPRAQEPELEETKSTEPLEVDENISATDPSAEEIKATEAMETEANNESIDANSSELTEDVKRNFALEDEAGHEEHIKAAETTVDIPRAQEPELEEIRNTEPVEVKENIPASDLPAEEVKETEVIGESTDANISEPTEDAKRNDALADDAASEDHVIAPEATVDVPRAQEPELEEVENAEHVEVEENISANDTQAEDLGSAAVTEETNDVKSTDAIAEEETPEEHVQESEAPVDIPPVEEPELEETKNTEPVEVHDNVATNDLAAKEVKNTEATEIAEIPNESGDLTEDVKSNVALADDAAPDEDAKATEETADIPRAQEPELEEIKNSEPVEVKENISGSDLPAEEVKETEVISESTDANISEDENRNVAVADEAAPEEHVIATEATVDIPRAQEPEIEEIENAEHVEVEENISADNLPAEGVKDTETMETQAIKDSTDANITELTEDVALADEAVPDVHVDILPAQEPAVEEINNTKPVEVEDSITADDVPAEEINDTEAMETEEIPHESTDDGLTENAPLADIQQAPEERSEQGSDPDLLVQSEDSKDQRVKAEETGQSTGATLEETNAEDNAANETDPLADAKEEHALESVEGNKGIKATEGEEASHPSQDAEELISESIVATIEPTSDIQQVNDIDEAKEMMVTEAIDDEETSCKKTEVATLEGLSQTDVGTSPKQKDESSELGEKTAFTTQKGESPTEEDVVQIYGEDTVGISNNIEQIKEQSKAATEADTIESGEHTSDQGDEQLHNVELQMQVCERSVDVSAIEQPDKDAEKVNLDQQQKEDDVIEEQTEEIQGNEQKNDDSSTDLATETLLEPQSNEIGTTDLNQDTDEFEATEMLMNEKNLHVPQGSIPITADVKVENSTEIEETPEQEKAPNNIGTLQTDAENYNEDEKENIEIDAAVAKPSTEEQDGTADETINEEDGNGLASPVEKDLQKTSDPAPSNEETLENDTTVAPESVEPRVNREERECINKANDDMEANQVLEEEIVDEVEKKQERQNEDTNVNNDEVQTKPIDEEASELHSNDSTDTKMDDTMSPYAEMVHGRKDVQPTEIEEVEDNKGFSSISEYAVEYPKQNDVEQDLIIHQKVVDEKLATAEQNGAEVETNSNEEMATSYTAVTEAAKFDEVIDDKASGADGALSDENLKTFEENRRNLEASSVVTASGESMNEDKEHHNLVLPAYSAVDGNITEQASGSEVTERGLLFPEKPLPTESEEHEENQTTKEQDEDMHGQETGDTQKEDEQSDLPVSNFLMNLIMGKESTEPDGNLEIEAEKKQEETTKDDGCLITYKHEESLVPVPTENKVDNKLIFEQGKHNLEGSEEIYDFKLGSDEVLSRNTHNLEAPVCENNVQSEISSELVPGGPGLMTEVETRDIKLGDKATNSEEGSLKNNLDDSENPKVSQENTLEDGRTDLQHESLPEDINSDAVAGQTLLSTEPDTSDEKKLPKDNDDLQSPLSTKREESTESSITEAENANEAELENEVEKEEEKQHTTNTGGATEGKIENLHGNSEKGTEAISDEQTAEITEPVMGTEINLVHEKEISTGSECEEETQSSKLSKSELQSSEKALDIQSDGSSLHINQDKQDEFSGDQIVMEKNNLLDKPGESNLHEEQEIEIGQESPKESDRGDQNCLAITEPVMKEENANRTVEAHVQTVNTKSSEEQEIFMSQVQERGLDVVSPKEAHEAEEMAKPKLSTDEEQSSKEDKSVMAGEKTSVEKTKDEEEAKSFTGEVATKIEQGAVQKVSHNQTRDLNVVLPTEAPGSEESFVDIKTPEFSTDEEKSPKEDESNMAEDNSYDEKTKGGEEARNFTDEAPMKTEERGTGQKASPKKHNILSGVGSKVKHQLAKVKKAIIGKPGHTKSELAKS